MVSLVADRSTHDTGCTGFHGYPVAGNPPDLTYAIKGIPIENRQLQGNKSNNDFWGIPFHPKCNNRGIFIDCSQ